MFFALWPDAALQQSLAATTRGVVAAAGGRPIPPDNFHVTLAFLGSVPEARISDVAAIGVDVASRVTLPRVGVALNGIEYWKKPKVLVATAGPGTDNASLANVLARVLESRLTDAGFTPNLAEEFRPHVTLARKVVHPVRSSAIQPLPWSFTDFALVESRTEPGGSIYTVLQSFPLGARGAGDR